MEQSELESIDGSNGLRQPSKSSYMDLGKPKRYVQVEDYMLDFKDEALSMTNSSDSGNESSDWENESENEGNEKKGMESMITQGSADSGFHEGESSEREAYQSSRKLERLSKDNNEVPPFLCSASSISIISEPPVFQTCLDCTGLLLRNEVGSSCDSEPLESPREKFLEQIFNESGSYTSCSGTASSGSQSCSNADSSTTTPPSSLPSTTDDSGSASSTKRKRSSDEEEEWDQHKWPRKRKRLEQDDRTNQKGLRHRRLACHFHLFDQQRYCKNNLTGKKYETCSGPGWTTMHYLKQHLGNSASSVHRKIRCPRCLNSFKTATAVLKHQDADPPACSGQSSPNQDDIDKATWGKVEQGISRHSFERLAQNVRDDINLWVLEILGDDTQNELVEPLKWELRKWNMTWRILFPGREVPISPFYDSDSLMSLTNTDLLLESFKGTVEGGIESGDIEGIDDETLDKLLECLRTAISIASKSNQKPRTMLRSALHTDLQPGVPDLPANFSTWRPSGLSETQGNLPIETQQSVLQPPTQRQDPRMYVPAQTTATNSMAQATDWTSHGIQIPSDVRSPSHLPESGNLLTGILSGQGYDLSSGGGDRFHLELDPAWDRFWQDNSMVSFNFGTDVVPNQFPNVGQPTTEFDFGM